MKLIKEVFEFDRVVSNQETNKYLVRESVRAVVFDDEDEIAILDVNDGEYFKIPWWGIEEWEHHEGALHREVREEWWVFIRIGQEVWKLIEYRHTSRKKIISYCYIAHTVWEKMKPKFTSKEKRLWFKVRRMDINTAIDLMQHAKPGDSIARVRQARELGLVLEAKRVLGK